MDQSIDEGIIPHSTSAYFCHIKYIYDETMNIYIITWSESSQTFIFPLLKILSTALMWIRHYCACAPCFGAILKSYTGRGTSGLLNVEYTISIRPMNFN